jgi:hypothetical protein
LCDPNRPGPLGTGPHRAPPLCTNRHKIKSRMRDGKYPRTGPYRGPRTNSRPPEDPDDPRATPLTKAPRGYLLGPGMQRCALFPGVSSHALPASSHDLLSAYPGMALIEVGSLYAAKWAINTKTHVIKQVPLWERLIRHPRERRCSTGSGVRTVSAS